MTTELARIFRKDLDSIHSALLAIPPGSAETQWRHGGWTSRQIVGHMLDSATNNRQRFVRAATEGKFAGPNYDQQPWVAAHGYAGQPWNTLLDWWRVEHQILAAVVDHIPEERMEASCVVGDDAPVTLRYLIEDYLHHQHAHLKQLQEAVVAI
jgi:hypothetical protein